MPTSQASVSDSAEAVLASYVITPALFPKLRKGQFLCPATFLSYFDEEWEGFFCGRKFFLRPLETEACEKVIPSWGKYGWGSSPDFPPLPCLHSSTTWQLAAFIFFSLPSCSCSPVSVTFRREKNSG